MGLLVDGAWQEDITRTKDGHFIRPTTRFRNFVTPDGSPGPTGEGGFAAEPGAIISMFHTPARGRIARRFSAA
jgi:glutathionyl-hydroquinone reductase